MRQSLFGSCWATVVMVGLAHSAEAGVVPVNVPDCVWWIRADTGIVINNQGQVTQWQDQSGHEYHLDHVEGIPPVLATGPNNRPALRFDSKGHMYGTRDFDSKGLEGHSLFLLARWTETDPTSCQRILSSHTWNWAFGYMEGHDQSWFANAWVYNGPWNVYGEGSRNTQWHLHTAPAIAFWIIFSR